MWTDIWTVLTFLLFHHFPSEKVKAKAGVLPLWQNGLTLLFLRDTPQLRYYSFSFSSSLPPLHLPHIVCYFLPNVPWPFFEFVLPWIIERLDSKLADAIGSNIVEKCDVTLSRAIQPLTSDVLRELFFIAYFISLSSTIQIAHVLK